MSRMIFRKAEREKLAKAFAAVLAARHSRKGWGAYTHEFDTRVGKLWIDVKVDENMLTVFGRFDEPDRAAADLPSGWWASFNPHSGKWNAHICPQGRYDGLMKDMLFLRNQFNSVLDDLEVRELDEHRVA